MALPTVAQADVTLVGGPQLAVAATARGASASAFDTINGVYLVVTAHGQTRGRLVSASGIPIGSEFVIQTGSGWAHFPRVAFSQHADGGRGAFLVTWFESVPNPIPFARLVSSVSGPLGTAIPLTTEGSQWETTTPAVAYSSASQVFLVVWENVSRTRIRATLVNNAGAQVSGVFNAAEAPVNGGVQKPTVAYNSATNEFLVAWSGWSTAATVDAQRVSPAGTLIGGPIPLAATAATYQVDATYNAHTNQYLIGWGQNVGGAGQGSYGRVLNGDGSYAGNIVPFTTRFCTTDSFSVAYSLVTRSYLMAAMDSLGPENGGVELTASGMPVNSGLLMTATGNPGNYYPRLSASTAGPEWLISAAHNYVNTYVHRLVGTVGGQPPPPPPPAPNQPDTRMNLDIPVTGSRAVGWVTVAGWAIDLNASSGPGVDAVHVHAFNVGGGTPIFLGAASPMSRPDIEAAFGSRFVNGGFMMTVPLPPGTYDIAAYAHSTVSGTFTAVRAARVTVLAVAGDPYMSVDTPSSGQGVPRMPTTFTLAGWALDRAAPSGGGVDAVHVWGYPVAGGSPFWVGQATLGVPRPDVAAAFGPQFLNSGFSGVVGIPSSVPSGAYDLVVWAHSAIGGWTNWSVIRVVVP